MNDYGPLNCLSGWRLHHYRSNAMNGVPQRVGLSFCPRSEGRGYSGRGLDDLDDSEKVINCPED